MKALLTAVVLAAPITAQANTQLQAVQDTAATCSRHDVMPADWAGLLDGWTKTALDDAAINSFTAFGVFAGVALDGNLPADMGIADRLTAHQQLATDFAYDQTYTAEYSEAGALTRWDHPSGWTLILDISPDAYDVAHSTCLFWHDTPTAQVMDYLSRPYLTAAPREAFGATFHYIEARLFDTQKFAPVSYMTLIPDTPTLPLATYPDTHPFQYARAVYLEINLSAFSREDR